MSQWYFNIKGKLKGPFVYQDLVKVKERGYGFDFLKPETLVWKEGDENWRPARETELAVFISAAASSRQPATPPPLPVQDSMVGSKVTTEDGENVSPPPLPNAKISRQVASEKDTPPPLPSEHGIDNKYAWIILGRQISFSLLAVFLSVQSNLTLIFHAVGMLLDFFLVRKDIAEVKRSGIDITKKKSRAMICLAVFLSPVYFFKRATITGQKRRQFYIIIVFSVLMILFLGIYGTFLSADLHSSAGVIGAPAPSSSMEQGFQEYRGMGVSVDEFLDNDGRVGLIVLAAAVNRYFFPELTVIATRQGMQAHNEALVNRIKIVKDILGGSAFQNPEWVSEFEDGTCLYEADVAGFVTAGSMHAGGTPIAANEESIVKLSLYAKNEKNGGDVFLVSVSSQWEQPGDSPLFGRADGLQIASYLCYALAGDDSYSDTLEKVPYPEGQARTPDGKYCFKFDNNGSIFMIMAEADADRL